MKKTGLSSVFLRLRHERGFVASAGLIAIALGLFFSFQDGGDSPKNTTPSQAAMISAPLGFEENLGQADPRVRFLSRTAGHIVFLTDTGMVLAKKTKKGGICAIGVNFRPADHDAKGRQPEGMERLPGSHNYFKGRSGWLTGVSLYEKVGYREIYPGVDVLFYFHEQGLEYDFIVQAGARPEVVTLKFEGIDSLRTDEKGNLIARKGKEEIQFAHPLVYQEIKGKREPVKGRFALRGKQSAGFDVAAYDRAFPLVIDPVIVFSTYLGGGSSDEGRSIKVDSAGSLYITGTTVSTDFPSLNPLSPYRGGLDVFVTKLSPSGSSLVYSTFLGGAADDVPTGIDLNPAGEAFITGYTKSTDFPVAGALFPSLRGGEDAFIARISPDGSRLVYSTYFGGGDNDRSRGIALDPSGNMLIAGVTRSTDLPLSDNPLKNVLSGLEDAFAAKLNSPGDALVYSTFLGGAAEDEAAGIGVDFSGNALITGSTNSADFPVKNAFQGLYTGGSDAFIAKFDTAGGLLFSTYLGGSTSDEGNAIAVDSSGNSYVTGRTNSADFPSLSPVQDYKGGSDAFVSKLTPNGSALLYSTHLGGTSDDEGFSIAANASGNAYVAGRTTSTDFPLLNPAQSPAPAGENAFVSKLSPQGSSLVYSTELGGGADDAANGIATNGTGDVYLTGETRSTDFKTVSPFQPLFRGGSDAFAARLSEAIGSPPSPARLSSPANGQTGLDTEITFMWERATDPEGNSITYRLFICANADFSGCAPVEVSAKRRTPGGGMYGIALAGLVCGVFLAVNKRLLPALALLLIIAVSSCSAKGTIGDIRVEQTVSGLSAGTTYFWKVVATDSDGNSSESQTWTFTTTTTTSSSSSS